MSDIKRYTIAELEALGEVEVEIVKEDTQEHETMTINFKTIMPRLRNVMKHLRSGATAPFGGFIQDIIWTIDPRVQTACTDGVRVYFNPIFADQLISAAGATSASYKEQWSKSHPGLRFTKQMELRYIYRLVLFVLIHEIYHMVYRHCKLAEARPETRGGRDHYNVNYSMDAEINRDIENQLEEFRGCTELAAGVEEGIKRFPAEIWSKIYTTLKDEGHNATPPNVNPQGGQGQQSNQQNGGQGQQGQNQNGLQQQSSAQKAQDAAQRAQDAAQRAQDCANNGDEQGAKQATQEAALAAQEAAQHAQDAANQAQQNAQGAADRAQQAANEAQDCANNGDDFGAKQATQEAADATKDAANSAQQTANNAQDKQSAQSAQDSANNANLAAQNAQQTAQDGNSSAQDAADSAQQAADAAQDAANKTNQAAQNAQQASQNAQQAGQNAQQTANDNNSSAQDAADSAQQAADAAQQAAQAAQQAQQGQQGNEGQQGQGNQQGQGSQAGQSGSQQGQNGQQGGQQGNQPGGQQGQNGGQSGQSGQSGQNGQGGQGGQGTGSGTGLSGQLGGQQGSGVNQNGNMPGQNGQGSNGQSSGSNQLGQGDGTPNGDGNGQNGNAANHVKITISTSQGMQNGDMITVEQGLDICEKEGVDLSSSDKNRSPIDHAESKLQAAKEALKGVGKGALARKLKEIDDSLLVPVIDDWKDRMKEHLLNAGGDNEKKVMKKRRFGTVRYDRYTPAKWVEAEGDDAADVFYLVDASGSVSDDILQRVFSEIVALEREGGMHIEKSCLTYFSTYIDDERIREWYYDTDEVEIMDMIIREKGSDPGGGTDIPGCINAVLELDDYYRQEDPHTVLMVFTDGEDGLEPINSMDFDQKNQTIFIIMNSKGRCESIHNTLLSYDIPESNLITIDTNEI